MKVKELVDYLFKNIAYSNTFQEIRNNILKALTEEYDKKITIRIRSDRRTEFGYRFYIVTIRKFQTETP